MEAKIKHTTFSSDRRLIFEDILIDDRLMFEDTVPLISFAVGTIENLKDISPLTMRCYFVASARVQYLASSAFQPEMTNGRP